MPPTGFFTDTTVCIGCKACEVACKQWNQLPDDGLFFTGMSYDNTRAAGRIHLAARRVHRAAGAAFRTRMPAAFSWLFSSDVCKHCARAGCLEACPTGAIIRTEFDTRLRAARHLQRLRLLRGRTARSASSTAARTTAARGNARSATTA